MRPTLVRLIALLVLAPLSGLAAGAQRLAVLSKTDRTLSLVDPDTLRVEARMPAGEDPHEVAVSPDGRTAYVSNYGYGRLHTITRIDLAGRRTLGTVDTGALRGPHGLAWAGDRLWFTAEVAKAIARLDPATGRIDLILGTGQNRTHMIKVWPDLEHIFTSNVNSGTISILDREPVTTPPPPGAPLPRVDWNETAVKVGRGSEGFDISPDHRELWVANALDGTISVIDIAGRRVVATLAVNVPRANRLRFTPDGRRVLVSAGPQLVVLDAAARTVTARIPVGHGSGGVLVAPDGRRAWVACGPDNSVAVVDLRTLSVTGRIQAGGNPDGMAWVAPH
jgi:YVTN family beta-propeller protein